MPLFSVSDLPPVNAPVLIDLSPLKAGGGCQLAMNFLAEMSGDASDGYAFLIPDIGPLSAVAERYNELVFIQSPTSSVLSRLWFERFNLRHLYTALGTSVIYTFFGAGLPHPRSIHSIVSVAYPIICYPDSPYWTYVPRRLGLRQRLINRARIHRLQGADVIVVETEVMRRRLVRTLGRNAHEFVVSPPAPSDFVSKKESVSRQASAIPRVLMLSGVARHKNLWRLPAVVHELTSLGAEVIFVVTTTERDFRNHLDGDAAALFEGQASSAYEFVGAVPPDDIQSLYEGCDALLSLSDLESFSNNYLEAWKTGTTLIVSDRDFAHEICGDSAVYVEPHRPEEVASVLFRELTAVDPEARIQAGFGNAKRLPTSAQKRLSLIELIEASQQRASVG